MTQGMLPNVLPIMFLSSNMARSSRLLSRLGHYEGLHARSCSKSAPNLASKSERLKSPVTMFLLLTNASSRALPQRLSRSSKQMDDRSAAESPGLSQPASSRDSVR